MKASRKPNALPLSTALVFLSACASLGNQKQPIELQSIHLTGAGHYIDLRYRVLDPAAAQAALGPKARPRLINESTGAQMAVPVTAKLGSLRQTQARQRTGRTYFVMFVNSGNVKPGSKVTAELGTLTFRHLTVQ
jgi:hypothetical protein